MNVQSGCKALNMAFVFFSILLQLFCLISVMWQNFIFHSNAPFHIYFVHRRNLRDYILVLAHWHSIQILYSCTDKLIEIQKSIWEFIYLVDVVVVVVVAVVCAIFCITHAKMKSVKSYDSQSTLSFIINCLMICVVQVHGVCLLCIEQCFSCNLCPRNFGRKKT